MYPFVRVDFGVRRELESGEDIGVALKSGAGSF